MKFFWCNYLRFGKTFELSGSEYQHSNENIFLLSDNDDKTKFSGGADDFKEIFGLILFFDQIKCSCLALYKKNNNSGSVMVWTPGGKLCHHLCGSNRSMAPQVSSQLGTCRRS